MKAGPIVDSRRGCSSASRRRSRVGCSAAAVLLAVATVVGAGAEVVIEDWSRHPEGARGVPDGWTGESWGRSARFDLTIVRDGDRHVLQLKSEVDRSTISLDLRDRVELHRTPILEWEWKVIRLPAGADARTKATADLAAQLYVAWPRPPALLRSRIIGYVWDAAAPAGSVFKSTKTGIVTYIVVRSGVVDLGRWVREQRNVAEDFRRLYGEEPPDPGALSLSIDSNDTRSRAESFFGPILFRAP